jgi:sec-independent protein translocase protein TatA
MNFLNLKPLEIILILVVVLLLFGAKRLPEMAKGIGQSVREFRKGIKDMKDDIATESKLEKTEKETEKA